MSILREVALADWQSLNDLHRWAWFPERSQRGWEWVLGLGQGYPGWVLEDIDGVCGFLGNIRQNYSLRDNHLVAATGYSLIVLPRAKGGSHLLLDAFRNQPHVFATSIFNSNGRAAPIYSREGFAPFPSGWANAKIVWPLSPMTIFSERIVRSAYRNRRPSQDLFQRLPGRSSVPRVVGVLALDPWSDSEAINRFWEDLANTNSLIAERSARVLQNRFSDPDRTRSPTLYGWADGSQLTAIALGQLGKMSECEAPILDIIDIAWLAPGGHIGAKALLTQFKNVGRDTGASRMRLSVVNDVTVDIARSIPGSLLRRRHIHGHATIVAGDGHEDVWRPTPYDGDFGFCLRPPPTDPLCSGHRARSVAGALPRRDGSGNVAPMTASHP